MVLFSFLFALLLATCSIGQFVSPPKQSDFIYSKGYLGLQVRYKHTPTGICEQNPNVKSFSGYIDIAENQHAFFWFFEARNMDPTKAPLTVWINGGPGSASLMNLFQENGPCKVNASGIHDNPYSWSNVSNMLYIDQPITVGLSYSIPVPGYTDENGYIITLPNATCPDYAIPLNTCGTYSIPDGSLTANSTDNAAPAMWLAIQGFMGAFPQYSNQSFNFACNSYGGRYGPVFNEYFIQQNKKKIPGAKEIALNSVSIGDGWSDPIIQYQAHYWYSISPGNPYLENVYNESVANEWYNNLYGPGNCLDQLKKCDSTGFDAICSQAQSFCEAKVRALSSIYSGRSIYDFRQLNPDPNSPVPVSSYWFNYLNSPEIQSALGAFQNYSDYSITVGQQFATTGDKARRMHTMDDIAALVSQNVTVNLYFGDADYTVNWLGGEAVANGVNVTGFDQAGYANFTTSDGVLHGVVKQSGKFSFVRVYDCAHEVPFFQPLAALEIFERSINGKDIATGKLIVGEDYRTVGPVNSTFREGNSTVAFTKAPFGIGSGQP